MNKKILLTAEKNYPYLDDFLMVGLEKEFGFSKEVIHSLIISKQVEIDNQVVTDEKAQIKEGQELKVHIANEKSKFAQQFGESAYRLDIVYQDDDFLVIDKPNNIQVYNRDSSINKEFANFLMDQVEDINGVEKIKKPNIVHLLDRHTTGLMMIAKNDEALKMLQKMQEEKKIHEEFLVLVHGIVKAEKQIKAPIGRHRKIKNKYGVMRRKSHAAKTNVRVLEQFLRSNSTLLSCFAETELPHQIRVHLDYIHFPVMNDPVYGKKNERATEFGQYVHGQKIIFFHPLTQKRIELFSPLPKEFQQQITMLRR